MANFLDEKGLQTLVDNIKTYTGKYLIKQDFSDFIKDYSTTTQMNTAIEDGVSSANTYTDGKISDVNTSISTLSGNVVKQVKINNSTKSPTSNVVDLGTVVTSTKLESGTNNGSLKLTVNGSATDNIAVKGLKAAAFYDVSTTIPTQTQTTNTLPTCSAVKSYVSDNISKITQFDIQKYASYEDLPQPGKKGVIYIVKDTHSDNHDSYDEYIWNTADETPAYEKIGNTDVNLSNYYTKTETDDALSKKQNTLSATQLAATNSGITSTKISTYDGYASKISTLENKKGLDKVGTVTGIKMNNTSKIVDATGVVDLGTVITSHQNISGKQDKLTAGSHITITGSTIAATWPTSSDSGYAGINHTGTVTGIIIKNGAMPTVAVPEGTGGYVDLSKQFESFITNIDAISDTTINNMFVESTTV